MIDYKKNLLAIEKKIYALAKEDPKKAVEYNEQLIEQGDEDALWRKIMGYCYGNDGYDQNPRKSVELIEERTKQGDQHAILGKLNGLNYGGCGYERDIILTCYNNYNEIMLAYEI